MWVRRLRKEMLPSETEARKLGYSQGVKAGNIIFLSGHVALDSKGEVVGRNDFPKQVHCVFNNLQTTLRLERANLSDIVKITVYLTDIRNLQEYRKIRAEYFKDWFPASTLVQVGSLIMKELMIEIDAVAILNQ